MVTDIIPSNITAFQAYFWYVVGTSVLFTYYKFNRSLEAQGIRYDTLYKGIGRHFPIAVMIIGVLQAPWAIFLILQFGFLPLIYSFGAIFAGMIAGMLLFSFMPYAQYIMPAVTFFTIFLFAQTVGWIDLPLLAEINVLVASIFPQMAF